jgi:hypothetical protein
VLLLARAAAAFAVAYLSSSLFGQPAIDRRPKL